MVNAFVRLRQIWSFAKGAIRLSQSRRYYSLFWIAYGLLSLLFGHTHGLAYVCNDSEPRSICYIENLTAGLNADENYDIMVGFLLAIVAVVWGIFRYKLPLMRGDYVVYSLLLLTQALFILLDIQ